MAQPRSFECLNYASIGAQVVSPDMVYLFLNQTLLDELSMDANEIIGHSMSDKFPGIEKTDVYQRIIRCMNTGNADNLVNEFVYEGQRRVFYDVFISKVPEGVMILTIDISESKQGEKLLQESNELLEEKVNRKTLELNHKNEVLEAEVNSRRMVEKSLLEANKKLEHLATIDQLTELHNRRSYEQSVDLEIRKAKRNKTDLAMIILDLDYFKNINDNYGHISGDEALRAIGQVLNAVCRRPEDIAFRIGGEEFVVLIPNTDPERARQFANKICRTIYALGIENKGKHEGDYLTASIGVSIYNEHNIVNAGELYQQADKRLYRAKQKGGNCVEAGL